jgi:S-adenosylmethionine:diacylglycerol 3-amino-3-carboxypropyl transferase
MIKQQQFLNEKTKANFWRVVLEYRQKRKANV